MHVNHARQFELLSSQQKNYTHYGNGLPDRFKIWKCEMTDKKGNDPFEYSKAITDVHSSDKISRLTVESVTTGFAGFFHSR